MDDDVAGLVREERIVAAAELASARGDARTASELFERACAWQRAAVEAARCGDVGRALLLAVDGGDDVLALAHVAEVAADASASARVTAQLERRGKSAWAARVLEATGRASEAARAWERAGDGASAARLYERAGDPVNAARALEAAMRRTPDDYALHTALGELLVRYGKLEAATRALQRVPSTASERRRALQALLPALGGLGLAQAREEVRHELEALGGALSARSHDAEGEGEPAARAEVTTRIFGRYEVVREVAATPTARVLECVDALRGERVAVKVFAGYDARGAGRDALARFEREVRVLGALDHPNVVPLRDYFPDGPAIVLGWMGGGTLEARLALAAVAGVGGPQGLTPARSIEVATAVLRALGEAHRLGVLHRDIKPSNVLFDGAGVTRLGDFGVAHLGDVSTTATAAVIGTLAYMSPEQRAGRPATVRSDLYGVGALLLEMLTGEKPSLEHAPRLLPSGAHRDLDARHDAAVLALLSTSETDRPADAFVARRALTALVWPDAVEPAAPPKPEGRAPSERPGTARLTVEIDGRVVDQWLGRAVVLLPLNDALLARAQAFARAGHPALQSVLRVDRDDGTLWLEAPRGALLASAARGLRDDEARALHRAVDALHDAGFVHGHIDASHVFVGDGVSVMLTFDESPSAHGATSRGDHAAVDSLRTSSPLAG